MSVLSLEVAKTHLNIPAMTDVSDDELQDFINAAEAAVERACGPLAPTSITERVKGSRAMLKLRVTPALELTSVTPVGGSALTLSDLYLDQSAGVIEYDTGGSFGSRAYTVVYVAGRDPAPDDLRQGVKELLRHMWKTQRGRAPGRVGSVTAAGSEEVTVGLAPDTFGNFPPRVAQLVRPYVQVAI